MMKLTWWSQPSLTLKLVVLMGFQWNSSKHWFLVNLKIGILTLLFLDLKKAYDSVPIYNVLMKIHHLCIRGKYYKLIENLYLSSKGLCKGWWTNYRNHLVLRKVFRQGRSLSHQFYLTCSLMIFLIIVINMEYLLAINAVVEGSLRYVLQQDLNLRNC